MSFNYSQDGRNDNKIVISGDCAYVKKKISC